MGRPTPKAIPESYHREAIRRLLAGEAATVDDVQRLKIDLCAELGVAEVPTNADVLARCDPAEREALLPLLRMKPTRSMSGVAIVTVQSSPAACPHGRCTYCPGGPDAGTAQSYTGREPAALRAARHAFDPFEQTSARLRELHATGHPVDKVDFIIQGGTFPARDPAYQEAFVRRALDAMNAHDAPDAKPAATLEEAQLANERARARMIGLTIETKPDWAFEPHVDDALRLGCTRLEIGVQSLDDRVLRLTNRGHDVADTVRSFRVTKDAGLKLCAHVMPGQPGSDYEKDLATLRDLFADERLRPDMLKIYPTLVIRGTPLFRQWERGEYAPVTEEYCTRLLAEAKARHVPEWCRIQRIDRDIPSPLIEAGVTKLNLRQLVRAELERRGARCRCIRCREVARVGARPSRVEERETRYDASGGKERFVSIEDPEADALVGFVRLREPSPGAHRGEVRDALLLRELRVYGSEVPIGERAADGFQHRGFGARLLERAEEVARGLGLARVVVTSGVGVREYYRRRGYERLGPYVAKDV